MAVEVEIDVQVLKSEIKKTYVRLAGTGEGLHFPDRSAVGGRP